MSKNPQLLILVGPPGSGKSTFAKYLVRTEQNWVRVSRDDFRFMQFTESNLSDDMESIITKLVDATIATALDNKCNVVADATHLRSEYLKQYITKYNHIADISFKLFDVSLIELIQRIDKRYEDTGKLIPDHVLKKMYKEFEQIKDSFDFSPRKKIAQPENGVTIQDESLPKALICDLDGTLALLNGRNPFDASHCEEDLPNPPVASMIRNYKNLGYKILLVSGREDKYREPTIAFCKKHNIDYDELWMRPNNDFRKDSIIKKHIYETKILGRYHVEVVLDDRNQVVDLWRKDLKLPCFQVWYGDF